MPNLDASFSGNIFHVDHPMIIAQNRRLATILPVRLAYSSSGYSAGTVLARNSVSGEYAAYDNGASSGLDTAKAVLFENINSSEFGSTTGSTLARAIFGGEVYKDKLVGLDSNAETDLDAKTIVDATGVNVLKF